MSKFDDRLQDALGTAYKIERELPLGGLGRLFLHAWRLELTSPSSGRLIRAESPLPTELEEVLAGMRTRAALA